MLVTIGSRPRQDGLIGPLLECHQRVRFFTALAERIGRRPAI